MARHGGRLDAQQRPDAVDGQLPDERIERRGSRSPPCRHGCNRERGAFGSACRLPAERRRDTGGGASPCRERARGGVRIRYARRPEGPGGGARRPRRTPSPVHRAADGCPLPWSRPPRRALEGSCWRRTRRRRSWRSWAPARNGSRATRSGSRRGAAQQRDLGGIVGVVDRGSVGGGGLTGAPEPAHEVGADRVVQVVRVERERLDQVKRAARGPSISATATARLSATIAVGAKVRSWS